MLTKYVRCFCVMLSVTIGNTAFAGDTLTAMDCSSPEITSILSKAKNEISHRLYITLATVDKNSSPWNAPVYTAYDNQYTFYWMSATTSQHSQNIRANGKTFAVIYDSTVPEGTGFGVYLRGNSYELNEANVNEIKHGISVIASRIQRPYRRPASEFLSPNPRRVYKFIPSQAWVNAIIMVDGKKVDKRVEITKCLLL